MNRVDIAIIANDRHALLLRCVQGILHNSTLPNTIIIVQSKPPKECSTKKQIVSLCNKKGVGIIYKHVPQKGISYKRNIALSCVTGEFYAFIDDDEIPPMNWIKKGTLFLKKHTHVAIVFGPKHPNLPTNYWNGVWKLITRLDNKSGFGEFATSSNGFYRTHFINAHHITYDPEFTESSEDRVFSYKVIRAGGKIFYLKDLITYHDFRTTFVGFCRQWFEYGYTMCLFNQKYLGLVKISSHGKSVWYLLQGLRASNTVSRFTFGLLCCDVCFALGYIKRSAQLYKTGLLTLSIT